MSDWNVHPQNFGEWMIKWRVEPEYGYVVEFQIWGDDDDQWECEGSCKNDSCMDWRTLETGDYAHFCSPTDLDNLASAFRAIWALAAEHAKAI